MAVNSLPNRSTGYSPFYLMYGYHPVLPVELLKGDEIIKVESVSKFLDRQQEVWRSACANMERAVVAQQRYYNSETPGYFFCSWGYSFAKHPAL